MNEHPSEQTSGEPGGESIGAGPAVPDTSAEPARASAAEPVHVDAPGVVPGLAGAAQSSAEPAPEAAADPARDEVKDSLKDAMLGSRKIAIMSPTRRESWEHESSASEQAAEQAARKSGLFGKRRLSALAAVIALATAAGAVGGALATAGLSHFGGDSGASSIQAKMLDESMTRFEADLAALKTNVEHSAKLSAAQVSKTGDRLDKIEKAQAEPAAKIAKLTETVDKLRAAPAAVAAPAPAPVAAATAPAAKDVTGSIPAPAAAAPKPEIARLPTVEGWVLRDVSDGGAVIEGRHGVFEVYAGDPVPGLGRVDAIRRQDGRWVVVTSKGLIVAR